MLVLPCRLVLFLLNFTLRPKFVFAPGVPAYVPAEDALIRKPPPPIEPGVGFYIQNLLGHFFEVDIDDGISR